MIGTIDWIFGTLALLPWWGFGTIDWIFGTLALLPWWGIVGLTYIFPSMVFYAIGGRIDRAKAKRAGTEPIYEMRDLLGRRFFWSWMALAPFVYLWPV